MRDGRDGDGGIETTVAVTTVAVEDMTVAVEEKGVEDCPPFLAPLLPITPVMQHDLRALLLGLRCAAVAAPASDEELLALVEAACVALVSVSQEAALSAAARPHSEQRSAQAVLVADKRLASGELAGDETLAPTMLVPLLRRANRLASTDAELGERLLDAVGTLTASLSGHGEHLYRLGLGGCDGARAPLLVCHVPNGQYAGVRCGPVARLGIGACATGWAGLRVVGRAVLDLGCGTGAVGLACAHLGAREVWCTDTDTYALTLAARNVAANGATAVHVAKLDMLDEAEAARPEGMPRRFGLVLAANLVYSGAAGALAALKVAARYVDMADPQARVLCCLGQEQRWGEQRSGAAQRSLEASQFMEAFEDGYEAACLGEGVLECGLRLVASEHVPADAQSDALLMLLLAPAAQHVAAEECVRISHEVHASGPAGWVRAAADSLVGNGACVLRRPAPIAAELLERCRADARPRLDRLLGLAAEASEGTGMCEALRFQELYSRAPWECRFDVTVPRGPPETTKGAALWQALLAAIDPLVRPVLAASGLFGGEDELCVEAVGYVLSMPGAPGQVWHPDSEQKVGLVNAFVPLVPLSDANGPTALALGSHRSPRPCCPCVVRPLLAAGEVLLFDWRTWHRGCANRSPADRPVAYVTYARRGVDGASYKRGLPSLEAPESVWRPCGGGRGGGGAHAGHVDCGAGACDREVEAGL